MTTAKPEKPTSKDYAMGYAEGFNDGCAPKEQTAKTLGDPVTMEQCPNYKNCEGQCFQCEYYNSTTHRLEYPEPITPQPGSLNAIGVLARVYCSSYASPHHIIFSVEGLRKMIKAAQPLPPTEPDDLTIAYMSGFADGKKAAQPAINSTGTTK